MKLSVIRVPTTLREEHQVFAGSEAVIEADVFRQIPDGCTNLERVGANIVAGDACGSGCGRQQRGQKPDRGCLPRTVVSEKAEYLSLRHVE